MHPCCSGLVVLLLTGAALAQPMIACEKVVLPPGGVSDLNPEGHRQVFAVEWDRRGVMYVGNRCDGFGRDVVLRSDDGGATWRPAGPEGNWSLKVGPNEGGLRVHPADDRLLLLGIENRGVFLSRDAGDTWTHALAGWTDGGIGHGFTFAFDPQDPARLYASGGVGAFASDDAGHTWRRLPLPQSQTNTVAVDPRDPRRLFVGQTFRHGDLLRSTDRGATWSTAAEGIPAGRVTPSGYPNRATWLIVPSPHHADTLFAATSAGLFVSQDAADTWRLLRPPPRPGVMSAALALAPHPCDPRVLVAGEALGRVILSTDGGDTWRDVTAQLPTGPMPHRRFGIRVTEIRFDPRDPDALYLARTDGLYRGRLGRMSL